MIQASQHPQYPPFSLIMPLQLSFVTAAQRTVAQISGVHTMAQAPATRKLKHKNLSILARTTPFFLCQSFVYKWMSVVNVARLSGQHMFLLWGRPCPKIMANARKPVPNMAPRCHNNIYEVQSLNGRLRSCKFSDATSVWTKLVGQLLVVDLVVRHEIACLIFSFIIMIIIFWRNTLSNWG